MFRQLATILQQGEETGGAFVFDPVPQLDETRTDEPGIVQSLGAAFLIALAGPDQQQPSGRDGQLEERKSPPTGFCYAPFYKFLAIPSHASDHSIGDNV